MPEKLNYYSFGRFSPATTELLIGGGRITPGLVQHIEQTAQAYFTFDNETFGGVLYHRDGNGPEKPYFKPEGVDWDPRIQAISRIGVQHHYWRILDSSLREERIDPVRMIAMNILVLHLNPDGSSFVEINSRPESLKHVAREKGDTIARYPGYISSVNYGGDADFYGAWKNAIFPMDVKTVAEERVAVERETLGIPTEMSDRTWQSWRKLDDVADSLYHQAVLLYWRELPTRVADIIDRGLRSVEKFRGEAILARLLLRNRIDDDETLELTRVIMGNRAREIMTGNGTLHEASRDHANNLSEMYEAAKEHCSDVYHYL